MDAHSWIPMRWPCGPLEVERRKGREGFGPDEREVLERWLDPRMLERLGGTPFDCVIVTWADGASVDADQQRALAPLVSAARARGLAVVGEVGADSDLRQAAGAAETGGLQALATTSAESLDGFPVLRFSPPSVADRSPRRFLGVDGLPWPGLKVDASAEVDATSGPTGPPWIDSNAWFVRLANELIRPQAFWLSYEPPADGMSDPAAAYVQAVADAAVFGARWVVSLDARTRLGLARDREAARELWRRVAGAVAFFEAHRDWTRLEPAGLLGVVSAFSGPDEWLSLEVLNLLSRQSRLYRAIPRHEDGTLATMPDPLAGLKAVLWVDASPPGTKTLRRLHAFVGEGGTLITPPGWPEGGEPLALASFPRFRVSRHGQGRLAVAREEPDDPYLLAEDAQALMSHRHDLVRVFNPGTGRFTYARSADGRSAVLHLFPYSRYAFETHVSVWFREPWRAAVAWEVAAGPKPAERTARDTGVEFLLPPEPDAHRPRSTTSDEFIRPAAAYRAVELAT